MASFIHQNHAELRHRKTEPLYFSPVTKETQFLCTSIGFYLSPYNHIAVNCLQREGWQQKKRGGQSPAQSLRHFSVNISMDIHLIPSMETLEIQERFSSLHTSVWYNFLCPNISPLASSSSCWICWYPVWPISNLTALKEILGFPQMTVIFIQLNLSMGLFNWNWTLMVCLSVLNWPLPDKTKWIFLCLMGWFQSKHWMLLFPSIFECPWVSQRTSTLPSHISSSFWWL